MPPELLLKNAAKQYFSQFGRIQRLVVRYKSRVCSVEYATEKGMQRALEKAGNYQGRTFPVEQVVKKVVKRKPREKKEQDPDWTLDPNVQEELKAMEESEGVVQKDYELRSNGEFF